MTALPQIPAEGSGETPAWALIGMLVVLVAALQLRAPLAIELSSMSALAIACSALTGAAYFYRRVRRREHIAAMCVAMMQVLLFSAAGSVLSYMLAREGGAFWDADFAAWDRALGLDWIGYVRLADASGWIAFPLRIAYASLIPQVIALVLALGFTARVAQLRSVMLAAIICGSVTVLLSPLFPAVSNYVHLGLTADDFRYINPWAGYAHLNDYMALRNGTMGALRLPEMQGIITFPSYHAGLATITLWGFWTCRVRWLQSGGSAVALATILATPVDGGHYFVDVFAGMAIAVASIFAARALVAGAGVPVRSLPFHRLREAPAQ